MNPEDWIVRRLIVGKPGVPVQAADPAGNVDIQPPRVVHRQLFVDRPGQIFKLFSRQLVFCLMRVHPIQVVVAGQIAKKLLQTGPDQNLILTYFLHPDGSDHIL